MTDRNTPNPLAEARARLGIPRSAMRRRVAEEGHATPAETYLHAVETGRKTPSASYCLVLAAAYEVDEFEVLARFGKLHPEIAGRLARDPDAQRRALDLLRG